MSDRLDDLRRQRERAAEQLAELEREIAAAAAAGAKPAPAEPVTTPPPAPTPAPVPQKTPSASTPSPADESQTTAAADSILSNYRVEPDAMKSDIKKGCFLYFFGALGFVALVVTVLYLALSKR